MRLSHRYIGEALSWAERARQPIAACRIPWTGSKLALTALTLAVAAGATPSIAGAAEVEGHFEIGTVVPQGFSTFDMRPTFGGDVTKVWSPLRHLGLGLEAGVDGTSLPYSQSGDLPARVGGADNLTEGFTVRPRLMFGPRFVPVPTASLGVSVGGTWLWYQAASDLVIIPYPTVSTAVQLKPGAGGRYGVRLAVSYMYIWSSNDKALLGITLAFTWGS